MLNVLVFSNYYVPGFKGGGPIKTMKNLLDSAGVDCNFKLVTSDRDLGDKVPYESVAVGRWNKVEKAHVFYLKPSLQGYFSILKIILDSGDSIVYLNSFFSFKYSIFPLMVSRVLRKKVVLSPRGEFSEGALSLKSKKKKAFINLARFFGLYSRIIFQASSTYEEIDIKRMMGLNVCVRVAENIASQSFASKIPRRCEKALNVVFVSRISPKKNILYAIEILKHVSLPINYDIYGPVEDKEYWADCCEAIDALPDFIRVSYKGLLHSNEVVSTLTAYDVFFFPTKGENYGHVVAEALCAGLPILVSNTTPWRGLEKKGIGWDFSLDCPDEFALTLEQLAKMPFDEHRRLREAVLAWAKAKFSQRDAVEANIDMFRHAYEKT